ncbi:protein translocase subunit SecF [Nocardioides sp. zg-536]|uniref:Protein-export membrane protein SecF n=1 Tax=Nocardioides faecalis TaxID=2803858 RepID=A0A938Y429_9ACTN|nr:protein translocase subunit SecF [Nocardioides faecalis]MBM9458797.1 protein translocase subunit SecF [Nocardioides faecalis]MBS4754110.1 protein translocase subunit SecF [Nocardioides faecalis]QVI60213.1 protein translocase subunit SecF [Nocardioides faecalis]
MGKMSRLGNDLYQGDKSFDFVSKTWRWYVISLVLVGAAMLTLYLKPLNMGVEFVGGTTYSIPVGQGNATQDKADELRDKVGEAGIENAENPVVTTEGNATLTLQVENLTEEQRNELSQVVQEQFPDVTDNEISKTDIGPSWGAEVAKKALLGIALFLVAVVIFIWAYFREWRMSVAALLALFHDIALTVGIYALSGFQVTPAAVTGLLAILGFSLYDTVVVFDKVKENTTVLRKSTQTYAEAANLAVNQTLVRSINTSIVALIPLGAILYVTAVQLGASSLQDLALAQFVGMAVGVYSSVMLAPRILVQMKMRESETQLQARRARAKKRALADRYAMVPAAVDESPVGPVVDFEDAAELQELEDGDDDAEYEDVPSRRAGTPNTDALGKGRVLPASSRPVAERGSGRAQPVRQPRSKRGKK